MWYAKNGEKKIENYLKINTKIFDSMPLYSVFHPFVTNFIKARIIYHPENVPQCFFSDLGILNYFYVYRLLLFFYIIVY